VTTTLPLVAPSGTVVEIEVGPQVTLARVPLNVTVLVPWVVPKFDPLMVTGVPAGPAVVERLLMVGPVLPVPLKLADCGLPAALSVTLSVPVRVPVVVGVNVTWMAQLRLAARLLPQLLVCAKSPLAAMFVIVSGPVPVFVSVTVCAGLVVPTPCGPNVKLVGERLAPGVVPVPLNPTDCGLPGALSAKLNTPVRKPVVVGVNVMLMTQLALTASVPGQLLLCEKSPVAVMLVITRGALPQLVTVNDTVLLVPTFWLPKLMLGALKQTAGATPVPLKGTDCGLPVALSVTLTAPVREPLAVGVNVTLIVQLAFGARVLPQLLV
jgi:hypothetical protein